MREREKKKLNSFENYLRLLLSLINECLLIICYYKANLNSHKAAKDQAYFYNFYDKVSYNSLLLKMERKYKF